MTTSSYRAVEPLYIVILRNTNQAEQLLRSWLKEHKVDHASVTGNRMMLHDQQAFEKFRVTWVHGMNTVTVWDTWMRRHIYLD